MKAITIVLLAAALSACNLPPAKRASRPLTLADCMFSQPLSSQWPESSMGGYQMEFYAVQSCQAQIDQQTRSRQKEQKK